MVAGYCREKWLGKVAVGREIGKDIGLMSVTTRVWVNNNNNSDGWYGVL